MGQEKRVLTKLEEERLGGKTDEEIEVEYQKILDRDSKLTDPISPSDDSRYQFRDLRIDPEKIKYNY